MSRSLPRSTSLRLCSVPLASGSGPYCAATPRATRSRCRCPRAGTQPARPRQLTFHAGRRSFRSFSALMALHRHQLSSCAHTRRGSVSCCSCRLGRRQPQPRPLRAALIRSRGRRRLRQPPHTPVAAGWLHGATLVLLCAAASRQLRLSFTRRTPLPFTPHQCHAPPRRCSLHASSTFSRHFMFNQFRALHRSATPILSRAVPCAGRPRASPPQHDAPCSK